MAYQVTQENLHLLEPLFKPWEEPIQHRLPDPQGGPSLIKPGRRPSECPLVPRLRAEVGTWRRGGYAGASDTTRHLLRHWFESEHTAGDGEGDQGLFRYYWCQREAVETAIYLYEVKGLRSQAELLFDHGDEREQRQALGIPPEEDRWLRTCYKIATGAGKTKIMTLAIVWSYFHALYEPNSELAKHFVVIAPNLTVFERLKDDFQNCRIFDKDPLIPEEWRSDFQMEVVLQDAPGGSSSTGTIYLTNIHRLYAPRDNGTENKKSQSESILGPNVSRAQALETGRELRERITSHPRIMVMNDEAHHVHDPEMAWNRAIDALHSQAVSRGNPGICMQLDFTATPKHTDGRLFQHIVCDFPLGEAVDAGIVKVPLLGESDRLQVRGDKKTPAPERYGAHLQIGYEAYAKRYEELQRTRKPVLFVMTESTRAADEVTNYLDSDRFPLLKGRVMNIHTNLRGRIKYVNRGGRRVKEFVENDSAMSDADLQALRELSRQLDGVDSPYRCVVSVLMLREGWDVRNVTTIVPLRPYSAASGILPEQTLGRGLRRMFPFQDIPEYVTVVEHPAFQELYKRELLQEGMDIGIMDVEKPVKQTVTIFVDHENKDVDTLELTIPTVTDAVETRAVLEGLTFEEIEAYFRERFAPLPIGKPSPKKIEYRERHLFTDEVVRTMELDLGLLSKGWSAAAYYAQQLGRACRLANPHATLAPLIRRFFSEVLFERPVELFSGEVDHRLADSDVVEHV
ncbi:MAG: DEAD/DEAH box helicase family protein, partial [Armatimonadota bacterium]|nr:DEAD/DEAH box helicase family protein [Armatimonadota bacterium]